MKKTHVLMFIVLFSMLTSLFAAMPVKAAGLVDHFTLSGYPSAVDVGQSFGGLAVTAYDATGSVMTDYSDSVYFTSSDIQAALPYTALNPYAYGSGDVGTHTFSGFTFKTVGSQTITVTDIPSGIFVQTSLITVNPALTAPTVTAAPAIVDQGQTSSLTPSLITTGTSPYAYQWFQKNPTGTYTTVGTNAASYSFATSNSTAAGSYNFVLQVTDNAGSAVNSTAASVTVDSALAPPTASASPKLVDQGQASALTSTTVSTGTSPYTYQWFAEAPGAVSYSAVNGANQSAYSFATANSTATGNWGFQLQIKDSAAATATSNSVSVTVNPPPTVTVTPISWSMDVGQTKNFTVQATGGSGIYSSYQWYVGAAVQTSQTTSTFTYTPTAAGNYNVSVKVTDSVGGVSAQTVVATVTVTVAPSVAVSPATWSMDVGQSENFTASATGGSGSYPSFQWYLNGVSQSGKTTSVFSFTPTSAGSYTITATVNDSLGATSAQSPAVSITVYVAPAVTVSPASWSMSVGQSKTFTANPTGGSGTYSAYQWYINGAAQVGQTSSTFNYAPSNAGTFFITVTVTDSKGVTSPQSPVANATVSSPVTVNISPSSATLDVGQSATFTANPTGGSGTYTSYQWYVDGVAQSGKTAATFSYTAATAGSPMVTVTVTDNSGSTSAQSTAPSVKVNSALAAPTVSASSSTVDLGQTSSLSASAVSTGTSPYTYQWLESSPGGSYVKVGSNSASFSLATSGSSATGVYSVILQITDGAGAAANSTAVSITANASPTVSISPTGSINLDSGQSQAFMASASGGSGAIHYQWYLGGSVVGADSNTYVFAQTAGSYTVTCKVTDSASTAVTSPSSNAAAITVTANSTPTPSPSPNPTPTPTPSEPQTTPAATATPTAAPTPILSPAKSSPTPTSTAAPTPPAPAPSNLQSKMQLPEIAAGLVAAAVGVALVMLVLRKKASFVGKTVNAESGVLPKKDTDSPIPRLPPEPIANEGDELKVQSPEALEKPAPKNGGKVICPTCKKEFRPPVSKLNDSVADLDLAGFCPHCNHPPEPSMAKRSEDDLWEKYFKS